jgi:hypothetical protein
MAGMVEDLQQAQNDSSLSPLVRGGQAVWLFSLMSVSLASFNGRVFVVEKLFQRLFLLATRMLWLACGVRFKM